jgi:hypothetical protein
LRGAIWAASSKQSGGIMGNLSTRFDGISDMTISLPMLQQISQKVSGDISRNRAQLPVSRSKAEERDRDHQHAPRREFV